VSSHVRATAPCLILSSIIFAGCGPTDDPTDVEEDFHPTPEMVGTWIFQSATVGGVPTSLRSSD